MRTITHRAGWWALAGWFGLARGTGFACAACFGKNDGRLAQGMNLGILFLLGVVVVVLGAVALFFAYLVRRSRALSAGNGAPFAAETVGGGQERGARAGAPDRPAPGSAAQHKG